MDSNQRVLPSRVVRERFGGVSDMCLWRWVQRGILPPPQKIGRRNFWREADVIAVQEGRRVSSIPSASDAA